MKDLDVVCVGLALVNFPVRPVDPGLFARDVTQVEPIDLLPGGDAANQAINLSRLGLSVALASKRGDDQFGRILAELMETRGRSIDLSGLVADAAGSTGVCAMLVRPDAKRHFCSSRGSLLTFGPGDLDLSLVDRARAVSVGGFMSLPALDGEGTAALFRRAKASGAITVADTKQDLWGIGLRGISDTLTQTDYFFPSREEAAAVSGRDRPEEMARVFLDAGAARVGIKLGAEGVYYKDAEQEFFMPAVDAPVVDTTGAGDTFMSAFIAGVLRGWDAREACGFASAAAALCVQTVGPNSAIENFEQVMTYWKGRTA